MVSAPPPARRPDAAQSLDDDLVHELEVSLDDACSHLIKKSLLRQNFGHIAAVFGQLVAPQVKLEAVFDGATPKFDGVRQHAYTYP